MLRPFPAGSCSRFTAETQTKITQHLKRAVGPQSLAPKTVFQSKAGLKSLLCCFCLFSRFWLLGFGEKNTFMLCLKRQGFAQIAAKSFSFASLSVPLLFCLLFPPAAFVFSVSTPKPAASGQLFCCYFCKMFAFLHKGRVFGPNCGIFKRQTFALYSKMR